VNTPMRRDLQMPPKDFNLLAEEAKDELRHTLSHPLAEYFVYAEHDLLDPYTVRTPRGDRTTTGGAAGGDSPPCGRSRGGMCACLFQPSTLTEDI